MRIEKLRSLGFLLTFMLGELILVEFFFGKWILEISTKHTE